MHAGLLLRKREARQQRVPIMTSSTSPVSDISTPVSGKILQTMDIDTTELRSSPPAAVVPSPVQKRLEEWVPPSASALPFHQRENVAAYLKASARLGVREHDQFMVSDLYEAKAPRAVLTQLLALRRATEK